MSECEIPSFYHVAEPVARVAHKCCECSAPILPGEKYLRVGMGFEGSAETYKQHDLCARACEEIRDHLSDECIPYGYLKEWWDEEKSDVWHYGQRRGDVKDFRRMMAGIIRRERSSRRKP